MWSVPFTSIDVAGEFEVVVQCGNSWCTGAIIVVEVDHIEANGSDQTYQTVAVAVNDLPVKLQAFPYPAGDWPDAEPVWSDGSNGDTLIVPTDTPGDSKWEVTCGASSKWVRVIVVKLEIKRAIGAGSVDYASLTDTTRNVLPGQRMNLKLEVTPDNVSATDWYWDPGGTMFKDYTANQTQGVLTEMTPLGFTGPTIQYYWADPAILRYVTCQVYIGSHLFQSTETFHVLKPTCTLTITQGTTGLNVAGNTVGLYSAGDNPGMTYTATVGMPVGMGGQGGWNFVQLVNDGLARTLGDGTGQVGNHYHQWVLDTTYPYDPLPAAAYPGTAAGTAGSYPTGADPHTTDDTPIAELTPATLQKEGTHDFFHTYVMFLPPGDDSRYVPLRVVDWDWGFIATNGASGWSLLASWTTQSVSPSTETTTHPQWTANWKPFAWVNVP